MTEERVDLHRQECIRLCCECQEICQDTLYNHLLERPGESNAPLIRLLTDCIDICHTACNFLRRHSPYHSFTCRACMEVTAACADACRAFASTSQAFKRCAESCEDCADACRTMSSMRQAA